MPDTTSIRYRLCLINGVILGRGWNPGLLATLFTTGSWLKQGRNSLVHFEPQADRLLALRTTGQALWIPLKDQPQIK